MDYFAVHLTNPGAPVSQQEKDQHDAAIEALRISSCEILDRQGAVALMDGLISVWLDLNLSLFGADLTDKALRQLRRDLPKIAATHLGMNAKPEGKPDA